VPNAVVIAVYRRQDAHLMTDGPMVSDSVATTRT
jgi:hypothetical protein